MRWQPSAVAAVERNRKGHKTSLRKEAKEKSESGGKAKGTGRGLTCYVCGGIEHPARLGPSEGWVNDLEEDALGGLKLLHAKFRINSETNFVSEKYYRKTCYSGY